jgi:hypothetical protein
LIRPYGNERYSHGYALFSYDGHFQYVDGLLVGATAVDLMLP